ncbi:MAG: ribonucleoside triphosphate reductase [bacterium]|nr:ribonucleoside triphosphate reductase [bacterium]
MDLLDSQGLDYTLRSQKSLGTCTHIRLSSKSSKIVLDSLNLNSKKEIPSILFQLSKRQARLFLDTYIKGDGWKESYRKRITVTDKEILNALTAVAVLAGYNFNVKERIIGGISKKTQYIITLSETQYDFIQTIEVINYKGIIWSVNTENETVIARRDGQVFITGNTPFTNVTLDLTIPQFMKDQPVIIGGKPQSATYSEFQEEVDIFNKAFLEVMLEGDAKGRVFTFPIPTYNITRDFNWDNPNIELLWEVTAKYGIPYFSNFINSDMRPEDVRSMCCRLRLNNRDLQKRGGGLFGANPLTGSIGVVTINMPRLGYLSKDKDEFFERLEKLMILAKESLEIKRKVLERFTERDLYPYSKFYLREVKKRFGEYWKNHFSTIGLIGMNEACLNLLGVDIGTEEGREFAIKVLSFMREKLIEFQEETGNIYNLEATPGEGTSYRLARIDKDKYPDIICANEREFRELSAEPFYTNSTQLPVNYTDDVFYALELQDEIQTMYTGGTVLHIFVGERIQDPSSVKYLIKRICENYRLPYITITPTFSVCPSHGYIAGEYTVCPRCGEETEIYSRVVGYLRPVKQWNKGKQEEFKLRKTFSIR